MSVYGITGTVTESGSPLSGITVALLDKGVVPRVLQRQVTDGSGNYQFSGLTNGAEYSVVAYDPSGGTNYNAIIYDKVTPVVVTPTDPYWESVICLIGNDSAANGTTTFVDQSLKNRQFSVFGNTQYSSTTAPTGLSTSMKFDGTGDGLMAAISDDLNFNSTDHTIECYFNHAVTTDQALVDLRHVGSSDTNLLCTLSPGIRIVYNNVVQILGSDPGQNAWYHYAWSVISGTGKLFSSGVSAGSASAAGIPSNACPLFVGRTPGVSFNCWNGYIAGLRITRGVGRYSSNFTPPTLPLPTN